MTRLLDNFSTFCHFHQLKYAQKYRKFAQKYRKFAQKYTNFAKIGSKFWQIVHKPWKNCLRLLIFYQSGKILPNLVTLFPCPSEIIFEYFWATFGLNVLVLVTMRMRTKGLQNVSKCFAAEEANLINSHDFQCDQNWRNFTTLSEYLTICWCII